MKLGKLVDLYCYGDEVNIIIKRLWWDDKETVEKEVIKVKKKYLSDEIKDYDVIGFRTSPVTRRYYENNYRRNKNV